MKSRHALVAVEKRVNPHQPVMSCRQSYERTHSMLFSRVVEESKALKGKELKQRPRAGYVYQPLRIPSLIPSFT